MPHSRRLLQALLLVVTSTVVAQALDEYDSPDYAAELNRIMGDGVANQDNAFVELLRIYDLDGYWQEEHRDLTLQALGLKLEDLDRHPLPRFNQWAAPYIAGDPDFDPSDFPPDSPDPEYGEDDSLPAERAADAQFDAVLARPWTDDQYPLVAEYLEAHAAPLDVVFRASRRRSYFVPTVLRQDATSLDSMLLPHLGENRVAAKAFVARANLNRGYGRHDAALDDLDTLRRLSDVTRRTHYQLSLLVAISIDALAVDLGRQITESDPLEPDQARQLLELMQRRQQDYGMEEIVILGNLMIALDMLEIAPRLASRGEPPERVRDLHFEVADPQQLDMLRVTTRPWFDHDTARRFIRSFLAQAQSRVARFDVRALTDAYPVWVEARLMPPGRAGRYEQLLADARAAEPTLDVGPRDNDIWTIDATRYLLWVTHDYPNYAERVDRVRRARLDAVMTAAALRGYEVENGAYPDQLATLVPDWLARVPIDLGGKPLHYAHTDDGCLVYSVGKNLVDEDGRDDGDIENDEFDDYAVRLTLP